ncbi:MAG: hypothetical protein HZB19_21980, partial [Chloroflexi bacterium]|nr:hypothetical protein [Chloroflexota bacterium]
MNRKLLLFAFLVLILLNATSCIGQGGIQPTASPNYTPYFTLTPMTPTVAVTPSIPNTITPTQTNTLTATPEPGTPPGCTIVNEDGKLYVLSSDEIFAWGVTEEELNQALTNNFPEWANYEQNVRWDTKPAKLGEIVLNAS